ncbi:hypothetical protein VM1G_11465 [Cytospora mali]|uniref:Uncharacterized protein n=1 Tax=Cytospora mali TaxID=578113 RepID=A0A194VVX6_CYTMA|nr:hypothetical protein VM1G_11465 [Valsa mali]
MSLSPPLPPLRKEASDNTLRMLRATFSGEMDVKRSHSEGRLTATSEMPISSIVKKNALVTASVE